MHDSALLLLVFFFFFLSFLNAICWHQWPMTTMWPTANHFFIMLSCPLKCVPPLCLGHTWWHFLVPWLTLHACWDWPSMMQTPSTIISVVFTCCFSSPAQVPTSMNWKCSLWWASISLHHFTVFVSYGLILYNILHIKSTKGISKVFSTCSSHIIAVSLFFGSGVFMYLKPSSVVSMDEGKISSVFTSRLFPSSTP